MVRRWLLALALTLAGSATASPVLAEGAVALARPRGRPTIVIQRVTLPPDTPRAGHWRQYLMRVLRREARRAQWGADATSTISFRFEITELRLREAEGVLHVHCSALGRLPSGRPARSSLSFGADPTKPTRAVEQVMGIVAHGVVTRLAELERQRRGAEARAWSAPPPTAPTLGEGADSE